MALPTISLVRCLLLVALFLHEAVVVRSQPPDSAWMANATLKQPKIMTFEGLGDAQGVSLHKGKIYLYGDVANIKPRIGVIREYDQELKPTGRVIWLRKQGQPLILHPTGLTWHERWGCFLGDTVNQKATIYRLDWERALKEGNLDNAVLDTIADDVAVNGCRPLFVTVAGKSLLATADYGEVRPAVRLYDVEKLLKARRSSAPGVVAHLIVCGPYNQNLAWHAEKKQLICIQNVVAGLGWQLDVIDLEKAIADGRADGPGVRIEKITLPPHSELEGYLPLDDSRGIFVTSSEKNNVVIGEVIRFKQRLSPAGHSSFDLP